MEPSAAVDDASMKINSALEDERIINQLTITPEGKMRPEDFRFLLFANNVVDFDSGNHFPTEPDMPLILYQQVPRQMSFYQKEFIDYSVFENPRFPTSKDFPYYSELVRVHKVGDYYMVTKMFAHPAGNSSYSKVKPVRKFTCFDQLEKKNRSNAVPEKFWSINSNPFETQWAWQMDTPRNANGVELSLPVVNIEQFRNRQMVQTVEMEESASAHRVSIGRMQNRRFVMAFIVPKQHRKFLINNLVYFDRELTRMKEDVFQWVRHPRLTRKLIYDRWNKMTREFMHVHSCSKIRRPVWAIGSLGYHEERGNYGRTIVDVVNRLDNKFLSNLLTAFLMNHLSWVLTASPDVGRTVHELRNYFKREKIPYNSFSVEYKQYLEAIGSCGPHDTVKVVVLGKNERDLVQLAEVFTFFVRNTPALPSEIFDRGEVMEVVMEVGVNQEPRDMDDCMIDVDFDELEDEIELNEFYENSTEEECDEDLIRRIGNVVNFDFPQPDLKTQIVTDMFAAPLTEFSNYFIVQGIVKTGDNEKDIEKKILHELRQKDGFAPFQQRPNDDSIPRKIFIVADIDTNTVKIVSANTIDKFVSPAASITETVSDLKRNQNFVHPTDIHFRIEHQLGELVDKSMTFVEILKQQKTTSFTETRSICEVLECDPSDIPLIFKITTTYFPAVFSCLKEDSEARWL